MNKSDLVTVVSKTLQTSKKEANEYIDVIFDEITNALKNGEEVMISGFGLFQVKNRKERIGTSPVGDHERIKIPATKTVGFKPGKNLKSAVK